MHQRTTQQDSGRPLRVNGADRGASSEVPPCTEASRDYFYETGMDADCYASNVASYGASLAMTVGIYSCPDQEPAPKWDGCYDFVEADTLLEAIRSAGDGLRRASQLDDSMPWCGQDAISLQGDSYGCSSSIRRFVLEEDTKGKAWTSEIAWPLSKEAACSQGPGAIDHSVPAFGGLDDIMAAVGGLELAPAMRSQISNLASCSTRDTCPEEQAGCSGSVDPASVSEPGPVVSQGSGRPETKCQLQRLFTKVHSPPPAPRVKFFMHSITTFRMRLPRKGSPHDIGNTFLDFLEEGVQAIVLKVRPVKFWITADIFREGSLVRVKARSYAGELGVYMLDMQRRNGCPIAFQQVYAEAISFYTRRKFDMLSHAGSPAECDAFRMLESSPTAESWGLHDLQPPPFYGDKLCLTLGGDGHRFPEAPPVDFGCNEHADAASPCLPLCTNSRASTILLAPLEERLTDLSKACRPPQLPSSDLPSARAGEEGVPPPRVAPLLDRAASTSTPSVQAESMYVAADLARDCPGAVSQGIEVLCRTLRVLLGGKLAQHPEAQFAFAYLMQQLAIHAEVSRRLAFEGIWRLLSGDFLHRAAAPVIRKQVAYALVLANQHFDQFDAVGSTQFDFVGELKAFSADTGLVDVAAQIVHE